jgi:hypothetical protein
MTFRAFTPILACALALAAAGDASAAWNNVFQVTCWNCRSQQARTSYYQPPMAASAPVAADGNCQQCNTSYVQRSYYEPVTSYERKSYYEPVTSYRTSYYYEPVTQCRTSYYYDPCSCSYKPVTSQETTYALKAQQCPVTTYVERCYQQPVTSYRLSYYYQPVTTCCTTTTGAPVQSVPPVTVPAAPSLSPAPPAAPSTAPPPLANPAPAISEQRSIPPVTPGVNESRTPGASYSRPTVPPVAVRPDRIASANSLVPVNGQLTGGLLNTPVRNANLWFVGTANERIPANTDSQGRFSTQIPAGTWNVYMAGRDGGAKFVSTVAATGSPEPIRLALR